MHSPPADRGMTLVELIIAMTITGLIVSVLGVALDTTFRHDAATTARYTNANNALFVSNYFPTDVAATPPGGRDNAPGTPSGCSSGDPAGSYNVLRLVWTETGTTYNVAYRVGNQGTDGVLWRVSCVNGGAGGVNTVARELAAVPSGWAGNAAPADLDWTTSIDDTSLRLTLTMAGASPTTYTVGGARSNTGVTLPPVVTVAPQPQIFAEIVDVQPITFGPGDALTVTVQVTNTGARPLSGVVVSYSSGTTPATSCASTLAIGASTTCTGTHTATNAEFDSGLTIPISITGTGHYGSQTVTSDHAVDVTTNAAPGVSAVLTSPTLSYTNAGETLQYSLAVTNTGTVTITGVTVTMTNGVVASCPAGPIAPASSATCTASYLTKPTDLPVAPATTAQVTTAASVVAHTASFGDVTAAPTDATVQWSSAPVLVGSLEITSFTATPSPFTTLNATVTYSVTLRNSGNVVLTNVTASHSLATGTCAPTTLAPGASRTCTATHVTTNPEATTGTTNTVSASATAPDCGAAPACSPSQTLSVPSSVGCQVTTAASSTIGSPGTIRVTGGNPKYLVGNVVVTVNTVGVCAGLRIRYFPQQPSSAVAAMSNPSPGVWQYAIPGGGNPGQAEWRQNTDARVEILADDAADTILRAFPTAFRVTN